MHLIYGLIDPRTLLVRYVGKSARGLVRPRRHRSKPPSDKTWCANWIRELQRLGLEFEICVLEDVDDPTMLDDTERWWITYGRACGWPLTNLVAGGRGGPKRPGFAQSESARRKIAASWTPERRAILRARNVSRVGSKHSIETRLKMSAVHVGKKHTAEAKAKIGATKIGKTHSTERRAQNSAAQKGKRLSAATRQKISAANLVRHRKVKPCPLP